MYGIFPDYKICFVLFIKFIGNEILILCVQMGLLLRARKVIYLLNGNLNISRR